MVLLLISIILASALINQFVELIDCSFEKLDSIQTNLPKKKKKKKKERKNPLQLHFPHSYTVSRYPSEGLRKEISFSRIRLLASRDSINPRENCKFQGEFFKIPSIIDFSPVHLNLRGQRDQGSTESRCGSGSGRQSESRT